MSEMRASATELMAHGLRGVAVKRQSEAQIFERAVRNDPVAFAEFYRRYHSRIYGFCLSRLLSPEMAADATQEVFMRVLSSGTETVHNPTAWLFGLARHVCIDVSRRSRASATPAETEAALESLTDSTTTEEAALSRASAENVMLALRRLRPRYRTALILKEIHHQPMEDIAESLGLSTGAAYVVLSRSRDAFGRTYSELGSLPPPCRSAVALMYRRSGSGISAQEASALASHISECPECAREANRATNGSTLQAVVPLLPTFFGSGSVIARTTSAWRSAIPGHHWLRDVAPLGDHVLARSLAMVATTTAVVAGTFGAIHQPAPQQAAPPPQRTVRTPVHAVSASPETSDHLGMSENSERIERLRLAQAQRLRQRRAEEAALSDSAGRRWRGGVEGGSDSTPSEGGSAGRRERASGVADGADTAEGGQVQRGSTSGGSSAGSADSGKASALPGAVHREGQPAGDAESRQGGSSGTPSSGPAGQRE